MSTYAVESNLWDRSLKYLQNNYLYTVKLTHGGVE
jgi:hypothetical protein